jgi:hypothetical protein
MLRLTAQMILQVQTTNNTCQILVDSVCAFQYPNLPEWSVGSKLKVLSGTGKWRKCKVVAANQTQLKIHYEGFHSKHDEWLDKASKRIGLFSASQSHQSFNLLQKQ